VGAFKDGKREGQGTLYAANGTVLQAGIWANDQFIRSASVKTPTAPAPAAPRPPAVSAAPKSSSGSAFRIANGQFVTNHHVIDGCIALKIDGNSGGRVVASDPTRDLALVSIANDRGEVANIRTTRIQLNETVTAAGFPLDGAFTGIAITNGSISRLSGLKGDTGKVQISAPVQPGNSGGPLLDVAGNVIGVVSSKLNALKLAVASGDIPQNVNFAINGAALRAFLDAKSVNYIEVSNERELTGVQIAARASAFTVLIECRQ
jgi:S1-C subfamily serine protease